MTKSILMDKYPIFSLEIKKSDTVYKNVDEIILYLKKLVDAHSVAKYIAIFNHYEHTTSIEGHEINSDINDAKNLIFCFGKQLPTSKILAVRPRSIGVSELHDSFHIDFLEVPNTQLQKTVQEWVESI